MTRTDLSAILSSMITTDRTAWQTNMLDRVIDAGLVSFGAANIRPLTTYGELELRPYQTVYSLPDCAQAYLGADWGLEGYRATDPWEPDYTPPPPRSAGIVTAAGLAVVFTPAPTVTDLWRYGSTFNYHYAAKHVLTDEDCTVLPADDELLKLVCCRALVRELSVLNAIEPITLHRGLNATQTARPQDLLPVLDQQINALAGIT